MPNNFKNEEQRNRWNKYNNAYSRKNYRTFTIKLNREKDKDLIDYLESRSQTTTTTIKELLREKIGSQN